MSSLVGVVDLSCDVLLSADPNVQILLDRAQCSERFDRFDRRRILEAHTHTHVRCEIPFIVTLHVFLFLVSACRLSGV